MAAGIPDRFIAGKRQFWREFLKLYQQMPELWDVRNVDYRNKELRNESYDVLQNKLREIQPNATKSDVGRRINIFRTNYRREQMRIWKQQELGLHSDLCKPTLWFYENMSFLLTQESFQHRAKRIRGSASMRGRPARNFLRGSMIDPLDSDAKILTTAANIKPESAPSDFDDSMLLSPKIEIYENDLDPMEMDRTADNHEMKLDNVDNSTSDLNEPSCSNSTTTLTVMKGPKSHQHSVVLLSEASEALAKSWAIQYEEMAPTQRILARKAIADILFEGCMGNLRINRGERCSVGNNA